MLQIAQSSSTFKEAMTHACHYAMLGCQSLPMRIEESEFSYEIVYSYDQRWRMDSELAFQHTLEGAIFFLLKEYESLTNKKCSPIKVTLDYQPQRSFKDYQKWFNCQVFIRDNRNSVVFRKKDFDRIIENSDYNLLMHLLKFADLKLQKLERRETPLEVASRIIVNTLPDRARVEEVAREMNMGVRTLQRRLKDEGTSFRDLLEEILLEFARNQIKYNKNINLSELAYLLNYSDLSAFSRAYRKHFGVPPTKHASLKSAA
jgi:AraC-like DNA-binding protein